MQIKTPFLPPAYPTVHAVVCFLGTEIKFRLKYILAYEYALARTRTKALPGGCCTFLYGIAISRSVQRAHCCEMGWAQMGREGREGGSGPC